MREHHWPAAERGITLALLVGLAVLPLASRGPYLLHVLIVSVLYAAVGQAWNLLGGYAGQLSIGHIMYFGVGAYAGGVLWTTFQISPWLAIPAGGALAALLGLLVSYISLRYGLRLDYYALFTLAISQILRVIALNTQALGGAEGIYIPGVGHKPLMMQFITKTPYFYTALALLAGMTLLLAFLQRTKMGAYLVAIRENEAAAEALGVDTTRYKAICTALSAALTAAAGVIFAIYTTFIDPELVLGLGLNFEFLLVAIVGGRGTLFGPILGALLLKPLGELTRVTFGAAPAGFHLMLYGAALVAVVLFMPQGLAGVVRSLWLPLARRWGRGQPEVA